MRREYVYDPRIRCGHARSRILEQKIVDASTIAVPSDITPSRAAAEPQAEDLRNPKDAGDITAEIQSKITAASLEPAGSNPVVHFPKGEYSLNSTIAIPANCDMQLVGDGGGAGSGGVSISWSGSGTGPLLQALGSDPVDDKRHLLCSRWPKRGLDDGGKCRSARRPYLLRRGGAHGQYEGQEAACDWLIDGLENSDVTVINQYIGLAARAVEVRGGRVLRSGGSTNGQVSFVNGYLWGNQPHTLNVVDGGRLLFAGYRNENNPKGLMTLSSSSSGVLTFACNQEGVAKYPTPAFNIDGFRGALNVVAQASWLFEKRSSPVFRIRGDGGKLSVLALAICLPVVWIPAPPKHPFGMTGVLLLQMRARFLTMVSIGIRHSIDKVCPMFTGKHPGPRLTWGWSSRGFLICGHCDSNRP